MIIKTFSQHFPYGFKIFLSHRKKTYKKEQKKKVVIGTLKSYQTAFGKKEKKAQEN